MVQVDEATKEIKQRIMRMYSEAVGADKGRIQTG
jgi:hypothetical protein